MLEQILHLSSRMAATRDLQPLLIYAVDVALDLFNGEHGYLILRQPDGSLDFRVKRRRHGEEIDQPEISHQVLDRVLREGQSVTAADARDDPTFETSLSVQSLNLRSVMCVPLIARDDVMGALYLDNRIERNAFTATDLSFLQLFANQAAVSIENAILNEDLEARIQVRTAELEAYAHTVAHDLKNPMTVVLSYAALLGEEWQAMSVDEIAQALSFIEQSSSKMCNIIDELLLLATVQKQVEVRITALAMDRIVDEARQRLANLIYDQQAEIQVPTDWPVAVGHELWVEEVWVNYLSNALKYGGPTPRIVLGADAPPGEQVRFWIRDNGPGIPPEKQALLFTEFTRLGDLRAQGHGLGLSIVRRIIDRLGGQVGAESWLGAGSLFWFTLPAAE